MKSGFFNSQEMIDDRQYDAEDVGRLFEGVLDDGIFFDLGQHFLVTPSLGMKVAVQTGKAWYKNTYSIIDDPEEVNIDSSVPDSSRIDVIVLEVNKNAGTRENSIKVLKGDYALSPAVPVPKIPTQDDDQECWQYALAIVSVPAGTTEMSAANITNIVGMSNSQISIMGYSELAGYQAGWAKGSIGPRLIKLTDGTFSLRQIRVVLEEDWELMTPADIAVDELVGVIESEDEG